MQRAEEISIPMELAKELANHGLTEYFNDCTAAHKREYIQWLMDAKKPETRKRRALAAINMLKNRRMEENQKSRCDNKK